MKDGHRAQQGFGTLGILFAVVVVVLIGLAAWAVYKHAPALKPATAVSQPTDPTAGWKTYCDAQHGYCFKYPTTGGWTLTSGSESTGLYNAAGLVQIIYILPDPHDNGPTAFTPVAIADLANPHQGLKIVGGLLDGYMPMYAVADASLLQTYPLTVGRSGTFPAFPRFTDTHIPTENDGRFEAFATDSSVKHTAAWFSEPAVKTSLLILESFYYKG